MSFYLTVNLMALIAIPIGILKRLDRVVNSPMHCHRPIWVLYSLVDFESRDDAVSRMWLTLVYSIFALVVGLKWPIILGISGVLLIVSLGKILAVGWMDKNGEW